MIDAEKATDWLIEQIRANGFEKIAFFAVLSCLLLVGVGFVSNWLLTRRGVRRKIEQSELKNRAAYLNIFGDFEKAERDLTECNRLLNESLRELYSALERSRKRALRDARDRVCSYYSCEYIAAFNAVAQRGGIILNIGDKLRFIMRTGIPHLQLMESFLALVNRAELLKKLDGPAPFLLNRTSTAALRHSLKEMVPFYAFRVRYWMFRACWKLRPYYRRR